MKPWLYHYGDPETFRLIPQNGVRLTLPKGYIGYNCCCDAALSPDGIFYLSLGSEDGKGGFAYLNRYNEEAGTIDACFHSKDIVLPPERALPGSKLHSCIQFIPGPTGAPDDYRILCLNHTTDRAPSHPQWLPYAYHSHIWESFPGSVLMLYDPKTGHAENLGIPVPHETIYGAIYDQRHNRYYMLGFMLGHMYSYDLDTRTVTDLGKVIETCSHRIHLGPDGHVYLTSPTGWFWRVNTDTNKLEYLGIRLPLHDSDPEKRFVYRYISTYLNIDDEHMLMVAGYANHIFLYNTRTREIKNLGKMHGADEMFAGFGKYFYCFNADLDADNILWYAMTPRLLDPPEDEKHRTHPAPAYLFRWDWSNPDASPECLGACGDPSCTMGLISEIRIDRERDILYASAASDTQNGPTVLRIRLSEFRPHAGEAGPAMGDPRFEPKPADPNRKKGIHYEGSSLTNVHEAFDALKTRTIALWASIPEPEESPVQALAFEDGLLRGICGKDAPKYAFTIENGAVSSVTALDSMDSDARDALLERLKPKLPTLSDEIKLPHVAGRQYLAVPSAAMTLPDGRQFIGTRDGKLCLLSPNGRVYALGQASPLGPVRALCTDGHTVYGCAGDVLDIGRIFRWDDENGLWEMGLCKWIREGEEHVCGMDVLSALAVSPDGNMMAVGSADLTGCVLLASLS
ncbi:MAG: hypothetical protein IKM07_04675 [Clostridia bacterium]|nr:hypothetical protein [Clostridia bacterium]